MGKQTMTSVNIEFDQRAVLKKYYDPELCSGDTKVIAGVKVRMINLGVVETGLLDSVAAIVTRDDGALVQDLQEVSKAITPELQLKFEEAGYSLGLDGQVVGGGMLKEFM